MQNLDLGHDFYLFRFEQFSDYKKALLEGPWFLAGHYLSMRRWSPNFRPSKASISVTAIWARFPELPIEYFDKQFLNELASKLGKLIKVDYNTEFVARVCVEIDTTKPLLPGIKIGRDYQRIEYEGVHLICFHCGRISHRQDQCPELRTVSTSSSDALPNQEMQKHQNDKIGEFGPWMMVSRQKTSQLGERVGNANQRFPTWKQAFGAEVIQPTSRKNFWQVDQAHGQGPNAVTPDHHITGSCKPDKDTSSPSHHKRTDSLNGRSPASAQHIFSDLSAVLSGRIDAGRSPSEKCATGVRNNGKQSVLSDSGTDCTVRAVHTTDGGNHCATPGTSSIPSAIGPSTNKCEYPLSTAASANTIETSQIPPVKPVKFLQLHPHLGEFPSLECATKTWREETILEVILAPLVETPALIRSPKGIWRVGMELTTRWDLDVTQQRVFRARLTPLQDANHLVQSVEPICTRE
ncbi:hypothetical protein MKX01_023087 [Papaver californicum]|nr:hypothetical protein MKX01_023087 [Papaver californicum]